VNIDLPQTSSIISMKGYSIDKKVKLLHSWNIIPQKERNLNFYASFFTLREGPGQINIHMD
jgi:hypothetical protein